jgi:hypothetical protein
MTFSNQYNLQVHLNQFLVNKFNHNQAIQITFLRMHNPDAAMKAWKLRQETAKDAAIAHK